MILEVGSKGSFADYFLISSGTNEKQVQAMADEAVVKMKKAGLMPKVEGYEGGRWILVDAGAVVLHLFHDDIRGYYRLEDLWRDAIRVSIPAEYYTGAQA
jgi:ribosome-associated protein